MAYPQSGGLYDYFLPYIPAGSADSGVMAEINLGATAGTSGEYVCIKPCTLKFVAFTPVGAAVVGTVTAPTVVIKKRPTPLSSGSESTIATLTIPTGTAAGKSIYKVVATDLSVGQSLQISWTAAVGGTPAGKGHFWLEAFHDDEAPANNSNMSVTA